MTKISALTALAGGSVDTANDLLAIVDTSATQTKKITVADLIGLVTDITGLLDFKGSTDCSANPNYPAASKGDFYLVSVAGKIGGASGVVVTAGDSYFATADNAGGTQAGVGTSWTVIQGNIAFTPVNIAGDTMTGALQVPDDAYDATSWNGSDEVPTKNALRDKIEAIVAGGGTGIDDLSDVDTTSTPPNDGDVLTWIDANNDWEPAAPTGGSSVTPGLPRGRLTLVTLTPVMTSDQTAKSTIYYTPYNGERIPIYDGAAWADKVFAELSLSLDTTNHPVEQLFDVFVWNDSGTIKIGTGPAWSYAATVTMTIASPAVVTWNAHGLNEGDPIIFTTSGALPTGITAGTVYYVGRSPSTNTFNVSTTRANAAAGTFVNTSGSQSGTHTGTNNTRSRGTGAGTTELELKNGIWTNKNSITLKNGAGAGTAGISANTATYVGTFYTTAAGQTGMSFQPAIATNGTNNILGLYNAYNRIRTIALEREDTDSWTANLNTTWRASNNSVLNRITWVDGLQQSHVRATFTQMLGISGTTFGTMSGTSFDSTNVAPIGFAHVDGNVTAQGTSVTNSLPLLGVHYAQAVETCSGSQTRKWYGCAADGGYALVLELEM